MSLYLVQHGKSLSKDRDPDQSLSEEGIADVSRIAEVAKNYSVTVSVIEHSTKRRALQTAAIFCKALKPAGGVVEKSGLAPLDDFKAVADHLKSSQNRMLVGHLPFMERLVSYLVVGAPDKRLFKFQNGGIVCLDQDPESNDWFIKWALMPEIG